MEEISVDDLNLVYDPLPSGALTDFISKNVINTNFARTGVSTWHPVGFFLRNKRQEWEEYRSEVTAFELRKNLPVL